MQYNVQSSTLYTRKWVGIVLAYPLLTAYGILLDCFNRRIFPLQNMIDEKNEWRILWLDLNLRLDEIISISMTL